jgi:hypothetical protein
MLADKTESGTRQRKKRRKKDFVKCFCIFNNGRTEMQLENQFGNFIEKQEEGKQEIRLKVRNNLISMLCSRAREARKQGTLTEGESVQLTSS